MAQSPQACRMCGGTSFRTLFDAPAFDAPGERFSVTSCQGCGTARTEPVLTTGQLQKYYAPVYYGQGHRKFGGPLEWLVGWTNRHRGRNMMRLLREYSSVSDDGVATVLDVGCGRAQLLRRLHQAGCVCHGVERQQFGCNHNEPGLTFHLDGLEGADLPQQAFDLAILWHVLEHLPDPGGALDRLRELLRPKGIVVIAVPNFNSIQARLLGPAWFHLDLPRHTHHFAIQPLMTQLEQRGFDIVWWRTRSIEQDTYGFVQSVLNRLLPGQPNRLYGLLKECRSGGDRLRLAGHLLLALALSPAALVDYALGAITGRGATAVVVARLR
jgi:SAM-dependent methyltransferase